MEGQGFAGAMLDTFLADSNPVFAHILQALSQSSFLAELTGSATEQDEQMTLGCFGILAIFMYTSPHSSRVFSGLFPDQPWTTAMLGYSRLDQLLGCACLPLL